MRMYSCLRPIIATLASIICVAAAQSQTYRYFTSDRDLSSSLINSIYQDSYGMLWVSTEDGLNRYDGSKFSTYRHTERDTTSLRHNFVKLIFEDSRRTLYVGTYKGLQIYNRATDTFSPVMTVVNEYGEAHDVPIAHMLERKNGDVLMLSDNVYKVETVANNKLRLRALKFQRNDFGHLTTGIEDTDGNLWLIGEADNNKTLYRISQSGNVTAIQHPAGQYLQTIGVGPDGRIYTASLRSALYRYEPATGSFTSYTLPGPGTVMVKHLMTDPVTGLLFIGTDGNGLMTFNPRTEEIRDYISGNRDFTLPGKKISYMMRDSYDNLWVGIFQKGVVMLPDFQSSFRYIGSRSMRNNIIGDKCVTALQKDDEGVLWVGTDNDGIYSLNPDMTLRRHYTMGIPSVVMGMVDIGSKICLGSYLQGWGILDKTTGVYTPVAINVVDGATSICDFSRGENNEIWIATMGNGVFRHNILTSTTIRCDAINRLINPWVGVIKQCKADGNLYLGTYDGLFMVEHATTDKPIVKCLNKGTIVFCIAEGFDGTIWYGTSTGLHGYSPDKDTYIHYTTADGLPSGTIYAIEPENINTLWVSTNSGLSRCDTSTGRFSNYHADDGLQSNEFYKNVSYRDSRGIMYFGGISGISYFSPSEIKGRGIRYNVRVVDVYLHGQPVRAGMHSGWHEIIDSPIYEASEINLAQADNTFSVEFSTLELDRPASVQFTYQLDDAPWETLPIGVNRVNFSNLSSGHHHLRVKTVDNGIYSDEIVLDINIAPVWYNSPWIHLLYLLIAIGLIIVIWRQWVRNQRRKKESMARENADAIKEARLHFFTNISHDIRTPMTLVISPLEKLMTTDSDPARQQEYRLMHRNAKRILRLVNELMDVRKIDNRQLKLTFAEADIVAMVDDLMTTFAQAARDRDIAMSFVHDGFEQLLAWVDPINFDKIVMNLLSNAIKFTPNGGKIELTLSTGLMTDSNSPLAEFFELSVTDTGPGIPQEDQARIFDPFFQSNNTSGKGTGLGLHLVHSLVKLHYGTVSLESSPEGSVFTVRMPLGNSHLKVSDITLGQEVIEAARKLNREVAKDNLLHTNPTESVDTTRTTSGERILIVEDDVEIRRYIAAELSGRFKVEECGDGKEALDIIFKRPPALVISDVMMPTIDGISLTRRLKKNINLHHIPVILLSARAHDEDTIEGLESGADAYITKPFNIGVLISTINNLLAIHKRLRNVYSGNQQQDMKVNIQASSNDEKLMERIMKTLDKHLSNPDFTVEMIAEEVGISRVHLHRKLKELTNQSPRDFIRNTRLRKAAQLMTEKKLGVAEVAMLTGFKNANNFATAFKELFGMTPTEYANTHHNANPKQ